MATLTDFYLKRNDTREPIQIICEKGDGTAEDLTSASVKFIMKLATAQDSDPDVVNSAAVIVGTASNGIVKYQWQSGDTSVTGNYIAEFQVTFSDGRILTYPNTGYIAVHIIPDLGN